MVFEISIRGDENFKSGCFSSSNQIAVLQFRPTALVGGLDRMSGEGLPKRRWRALIEENLHSSSFEGASGCMFEYGSGLLRGDARKPIDELMQRRIVFKVLEERRDRHTRTCEHPSAAHAAGVTLNCGAGGPINHANMVAPGASRAAYRHALAGSQPP